MKLRFLSILLVGLLLTGCAGNGGNSQVQFETTQKTATQESSIQSNTGEETNESEAQEEPYILTFEASTIEEETVTSDCFADSRLTMINVWATYCNPCLSEMPDLGEIANSYDSADFQMIGIVSDVMEGAEEEELANVKLLIEETKADYPHLLLNESLYMNLVGGVSSVPTTFFVNQKGEVLGYALGAQSKETWESIINDLLAEME